MTKNKEKFLVVTSKRTYELFAANEKEREIWLQYFCRIIDSNAGKPINLNEHSDAYKTVC